ncbi:MAG: 50S ribosomal protein L32 [Patescibacteria group bacterium]
MGVPRARRTKSKQGHRRSHLALKKKVLTACSNCKMPSLPHAVCASCGYYRGKQVVEVSKLKNKKSNIKNQK